MRGRKKRTLVIGILCCLLVFIGTLVIVRFTLSKNEVSKPEQGGVITPVKTCETEEINLAGECFHIMSEDDTSYTLLSKHNLLVGSAFVNGSTTLIDADVDGYGLQSADASGMTLGEDIVGTIKFADADELREESRCTEGVIGCHYGYWHDMTNNTLLSSYGTSYTANVYDSNSNLYKHVENYETYLKGKGYKSVEARLMTYKEAEDLGCSGSSHACFGPEWLSSTSYWLGSADSNNSVWTICNGIATNFLPEFFDTDGYFGVRPTITILKSEI